MMNIVWFRRDLRLSDNPALFEAAQKDKIFPIYILEDESEIGDASKWWLFNSLKELDKSLEGKLNIYTGEAKDIILHLIKEKNIDSLYLNRRYEPSRVVKDKEIKIALENININYKSFNASLLWEPWEIIKKDSSFYKRFTPFYRNGCLKSLAPRIPLNRPSKLILESDKRYSYNKFIEANNNCDKWHKKLDSTWQVGEEAAQKKLFEFLDNDFACYAEGRNFPAQDNISKLSPHIHFGEISPNQILYSAKESKEIRNITTDNLDKFVAELGWREFAYYMLYHFPQMPKNNFQSKFNNFPWSNDFNLLQLWKDGKTGYPIIDAGMRELQQTGFMHNRVRMIVGSFLVKNLLVHWHYGADWFKDCLVDADLASNIFNWQWIAGCGVDAAPYFRIFNPVLQGEKFDPYGEYTTSFVPELKNLPSKYLFRPWEAPQNILKEAGVILGKNYPSPIVDLGESRLVAMKAYRSL